MKKLFLFALAGMMMFAFTQCGGGGAFNSAKSMFEKAISDVEKASTCEELRAVEEAFEEEVDALYKDYHPTEQENKELGELHKKVLDADSKKVMELCY